MTQRLVNNWLLDLPSGSIIHQQTGERKRLGEYQLKLLDLLVKNAGTTLSREQLMNQVWENRIIGNNSLPNAIHALRIAVDDDGKEQRIIKTVPKIGYLLEKEYCTTVAEPIHATEDPILLPEVPNQAPLTPRIEETPQLVEHTSPLLLEDQQAMHAVNRTASSHSRLIYGLFALCLLFTLAIGYLLVKQIDYNNKNDPHWGNYSSTLVSYDQQLYSNIKFYEVFPLSGKGATNSAANTLLLEKKLSATLDTLNPQLAARKTQLTIYFRMREFLLNYAFLLKSPCGENELSMHIYHWRLDDAQLNELIYKETERKLNEMVSCSD